MEGDYHDKDDEEDVIVSTKKKRNKNIETELKELVNLSIMRQECGY